MDGTGEEEYANPVIATQINSRSENSNQSFDMTTPQYIIEKPVWTDADFERMGWHDVHVHAFAFHPESFELLLDIDYIFNWVAPQGGETHYSFWVAPATLVFEDVYNLKFELESPNGDMSLQGLEHNDASPPINADKKKTEWRWLLDLNEGRITFRSVGFSQFTRRPPILAHAQKLMFAQRGGVSFERDYIA